MTETRRGLGEELLMTHGAYGPFIHVGAHNRGGHPYSFSPAGCYSVWSVEDGAAELTADGERTSLDTPAAVLFQPNQQCRLDIPRGSTWYRLSFDIVHQPRRRGQGGGTFVHKGRSQQPPSEAVWGVDLPVRVPSELLPACLRMLRFCCGFWWGGDFNYVRANMRLGEWLIEYAAWSARTTPLEGLDWATRLEETVRRKLAFGITVAELAREAGLSTAHLRRRYRAARNRTLRDFIAGTRLDEACRLLRGTDHSVRDIAHVCGYRSSATFCHRFRDMMKTTPSAWRRDNRL